MSIWHIINELEQSQDLVLLRPEFESSEAGRFVFATPEVCDDLYGQWNTAELQDSYARARQVIDAFIDNRRISARCPPCSSAKAQLALLKEPSEEVWEFRSRPPPKGIRVFGRFAAFDVFIATNTALREKIDADFKREKEICKRRWRSLFEPYKPHSGTQLADYLSNFHDLGNPF